jgi:enamine deaminase RidA (YjgF/YER057c/UK114 family)
MDLETGKLVKGFQDLPQEVHRQLSMKLLLIDVPDERILCQTWCIFKNLKDLLAQEGLSLDNIIHQRFFLKDMKDLSGLERVILTFMPKERPSTTIIEATNAGVNEEIAVQADFIVLSGEGGMKRENIRISDLDHLTAPYPLGTRAGQYIFTTPLPGVDPETGKLVSRFAELRKEEQTLAEPPYTAKGEALAVQQIMAFRHIRRILESQGSSLAWQLRQNGWLRIPMREFGPVAKVRRKLFSGENAGPFTSLTVSGVRREDAFFEYSVIALVPPKGPNDHKRQIVMAPHGIASYYVGALKSGPYVVTAGEVPVDTKVPCVVKKFADLKGEETFLDYGRVHETKAIMAEAYFVYRELKSCMEIHGSSMGNVVHQTVYMANPADYPALERIATLFYGSELPPTTLIPILGTSPFAQATLEIELFGLTGN